MEFHDGSGPVGITDGTDLVLLFSHSVGLGPDVSVAMDVHLEKVTQGVYDGRADSVESAGDLVGVVVELSAGMEL